MPELHLVTMKFFKVQFVFLFYGFPFCFAPFCFVGWVAEGGRGGGGGEGERKDATREPVSVLMLHDVFFFLYCLLLVFPNHVIIQKTI